MDMEQAKRECAVVHNSATEEYWACVRAKFCPDPASLSCDWRIALEQIGDFLMPAPLAAEPLPSTVAPLLIERTQKMRDELDSAQPQIASVDVFELAQALQQAGMHKLAIQGLQFVVALEEQKEAPQLDLASKAMAVKALSHEQLGQEQAAAESKLVASLLRRRKLT